MSLQTDSATTTPAASGRPRSYPHAMRLKPWVWHTTFVIAQLILRVTHRIVVRGHDVPPGAPVIIAAKHASGWDVPLLSWIAKRYLGIKPYFQMGSFIGYPVLSRIMGGMRACGGFPVMRPKEVLRLRKRTDVDRARIHEMMDEVNGIAEATRRAVLETGQVLVFFPEGTRDNDSVRPVRGLHEIHSALSVARSGRAVWAWPVVLSYGPKKVFRRLLLVDLLPAIPVGAGSAEELAAGIEAGFRSRWVPSSDVPAAVAGTSDGRG